MSNMFRSRYFAAWTLIICFCIGISKFVFADVLNLVSFETIIRQKLEINVKNASRGRINKCEAEGVLDIRSLKLPFEEFWAYIPGRCVWIELGVLEEIRGGIRLNKRGECLAPITISGIKKKDVFELINILDSITLYHPHPSNKALVGYVQKTPSNSISQECFNQASAETLEAALPGLPDLNSMFLFSRQFYRQKPLGTFMEKIVSIYGVTEYGLLQNTKAILDAPDYFSLQRADMRHYYQLRRSFGKSEVADMGEKSQNNKKLYSIIQKLNSKLQLFYISFKPFPEAR
ncbi:MAG: hypothetical protein VX617_01620 [Pseudomonadota bacterium]|nr:hypothetical protein [Pseudomonadota bacterium]